jgi:isopentenyl-diphosphate delta-isomerase
MEYLDVVNDKNEVIGRAERVEINQKKLPHRIVHILVFNSKGKIVLHKRTPWNKFCPNCWTTSAGGYVQAGETYEQAGLREYKEELGVTSQIELAYEDIYEDNQGLKKFLQTFKTVYNGPFNPDQEKVSEIRFLNLNEIRGMIKNKELFHPELIYILQKHFNI